MNNQEMTSRIIKLQLEITKALSNGHKASDTDEFQEQRIELKMEKEKEELFCEYSGLPSPKSYETN